MPPHATRLGSFIIAALVLFIGLEAVWADGKGPITSLYTHEMFDRALKNRSTAPSYILYAVKNGNTGECKIICTVAPFLMGALQFETGIETDEAGMKKMDQILSSNQSLIFSFKNPKALENIKPLYTDLRLKLMRSEVNKHTLEELRKFDFQGLVGYYTQANKGSDDGGWRDAIAYVLLERGLSCRQGDIDGGVHIGEPEVY